MKCSRAMILHMDVFLKSTNCLRGVVDRAYVRRADGRWFNPLAVKNGTCCDPSWCIKGIKQGLVGLGGSEMCLSRVSMSNCSLVSQCARKYKNGIKTSKHTRACTWLYQCSDLERDLKLHFTSSSYQSVTNLLNYT